ncbi:MAG TPA: hypothetical protein VE961_28115 [Pyrinomonadaceae bacterium]|nr:hypothetical protein [Pyrinomonadaceae bacterium]
MAGYSGTPLIKKLGIKPDYCVAFVNAPENFVAQLELPASVTVKPVSRSRDLDFVHLFVKSRRSLADAFAQFAGRIKPDGMFWVSWPKKASGVQTDLNENIVRDIGLAAGLVDVKVCAVDDIWSGLKFVYRLSDRPKLKRI